LSIKNQKLFLVIGLTKMLNNKNWNLINKRLLDNNIIIIDNFFTEDTVNKLKDRIKHSKNFHNIYEGYKAIDYRKDNLSINIAKKIEKNLLCLKDSFVRAWSFIYDNKCKGVDIHADPSVININTWLTKNESVNNFNLNGLVIYPKKPLKHWTREQWNGNFDKTDLLKDVRPIHIGYKYNRAVFFDGSFFHKTNDVDMKEGDENKRISYTMLFGRNLE